MSTTNDKDAELIRAFNRAYTADRDALYVECHVAGLRAAAAAAWDEAMAASSTGVIIDGKYVKHPNPYGANALVVDEETK